MNNYFSIDIIDKENLIYIDVELIVDKIQFVSIRFFWQT